MNFHKVIFSLSSIPHLAKNTRQQLWLHKHNSSNKYKKAVLSQAKKCNATINLNKQLIISR